MPNSYYSSISKQTFLDTYLKNRAKNNYNYALEKNPLKILCAEEKESVPGILRIT